MKDAKAYTRIHYKDYYRRALKRAQKFSIVLERFISPEGTFPVFGRSIPYRMGAMQPLALMAWYQKLPAGLTYGQVRNALTSVMHTMFDGKENFRVRLIEYIDDTADNEEDEFLRGFGSFITKTRKQKTARNISKGETIIIPEHKIPAFKPAKVFIEQVKENNK